MNSSLKHTRRWRLAALLGLAVLCCAACFYLGQPDGSTVESREKLLKESTDGAEWNIVSEREVGSCLLSGMESGGKSGIAVFKSDADGKYELVSSEWRDAGEVVLSQVLVDGEWYDVAWFHGAAVTRAEMTYAQTGSGQTDGTVSFSSDEVPLLCAKAPAKDYVLEVRYYDAKGSVYE